MKSFIQFFTEKSFADILTDEFLTNLEQFIFTNDKKYLKFFSKLKSFIPDMFMPKGYLYRGMILSKADYEKLNNAGIILKDYSSWTDKKDISKSFVVSPKKRIGKISKDSVGVIFKKKFKKKDVVLPIYSLVLYLNGIGKLDDMDELNKEMAMDEHETVINKGIKLTSNDIDEIVDLKV